MPDRSLHVECDAHASRRSSLRRHAISRRSLLTAVFALPIVAACQRGSDQADPAGTAWSFTDDRGVTVALPKRPERIVAYVGAAAALWDYGIQVVGTFGPRRLGNGSKDPRLGDVDTDSVASVGDEYGQLDVEKLASLRPDLIVTEVYLQPDLWYITNDVAERVQKIAPAVGIGVRAVAVTTPISRFEELALALGADLEAPPVTEARQRFDRASDDLRAAISEKPGLKVLVTSGAPQTLYVVKPEESTDLLYFHQLGLDIITPDTADQFFESLSWEQALKYPADLILTDARPQALQPDQLRAIPTWNEMPAVKAGQVAPHRAEAAYSRLRFAMILEELTEHVRHSRADVV